MGEQRHWALRAPRRFLAEIVVLSLLAFALASYQFDLGERWFGGPAADPTTQPAEVAPPVGLALPATRAAGAVSGTSDPARALPASVAAVVEPLLRRKVLGPHVGVQVSDLATGRSMYRSGASAVTPASTTKLLTGLAALEALGPMARLRTTASYLPGRGEVVLVGGGDPFLASSPRAARSAYPDGGDVLSLAREVADNLRARDVRRVRVGFDDSYFSGPAVNPAWPATYVPQGVVPPITALWVEQGRDSDGSGYVDDPSSRAAQVFADALRDNGVTVRQQVRRVSTPPAGTEVGSVSSAPLGEVVERTLAVSDNQAAEALARHVGLAELQEGSFEAGAAAVLEVLQRLGVPVAGSRLYDGSGLSRDNLVTTRALVATLRVAASPDHPQLRQVVTGLPVAGFTGSLTYRFDTGPAQARGRVRAKTGTLTGVHGLAGIAEDATGARMAFAIVADRVRQPKNLEAQVLIDRIAGALGACTCGVGSAS